MTLINVRFDCCVCGRPELDRDPGVMLPLVDPEWAQAGYQHFFCSNICFLVFKRFPL